MYAAQKKTAGNAGKICVRCKIVIRECVLFFKR